MTNVPESFIMDNWSDGRGTRRGVTGSELDLCL